MATAVQIELLVDEKGALQGLRTFDTAIKGAKSNVVGLDASLKSSDLSLQKLNSHLAAKSGASEVDKLAKEFTGGESSLRTMNAEVRSLKGGIVDDTRAASEFLATLPGVGKAMELAFPIFGATALVGVIAAAGKELYDSYEKWVSLDSAAEEYQQTLDKIKDEDFIKVRDIETATDRIKEATDAARGFQQVAQQMHGGLFRDVVSGLSTGGFTGGIAAAVQDTYGARQMANEGYKRQGQVDELKPELAALHHQQILDAIELSHAGDERLSKEQRITAEKNKQHAIDEENRKYEAATSAAHGNATSPNAGASHQRTLDAIADAKASADLFTLRKEQNRQLRELHEQALEARLRGAALYAQQEKYAIDKLKDEDINTIAARQDVHDKFHAEELKRLEAENAEIQKMHETTQLAGLTGIAKIQQEGKNRISDLYRQQALNPTMNPGQLLAATKEIADQTKQQIEAVYRTFGDQVDSVLAQSTARTLQGFARIHAEAQRQIQDLERDYREKGGRPQDLTRGEAGIRADEATQVADLERRNADETAKIEAEAHSRSLSAEKQQTLAIQSEYNERLRQYQDQLDQQLISQEDFNRRVAAAEEERDAQMAQAARQTREKMAGEFTSFFKNPLEAMKEMGEKAAGQAAAALVQRIQVAHGTRSPEGVFNDTWSMGGIMDRIAGAHRGALSAHRSESIASGSIAMSSAEIHVGAANVHLPGFGGANAAPLTGGVPFSGGGSTQLLSMPGTFGEGSTSGEGSDLESFGKGGAPFFSSGGTVDGGRSNPVSNGIGDVNQSISLVKQARSIFAPGSGAGAAGEQGGFSSLFSGGSTGDGVTFPFQIGEEPMQSLSLPGQSTSSGFGSSLMGGGGMGAVGGAAGGAMGLYAAYQGNGGFGGALGGAMSGMELGMSVGGPIGAAVGLAAGAIIGAIGFGGREKARVYDLKQVRPRLANDIDGFQQGTMDYTSAYADMQSLDQDSRKMLDRMGGAARQYYWDTINKEIHQAEGKLTAEERAGRSRFTATAAQFDQGGWSEYDGWARMRKGEFVVHEQPAAEHAGALEAIRAGASHADMARFYGLDDVARSYRAAMAPSASPAAAGGDRSVTMNFHTLDSKTAAKMFMDNKHHIRAALNASFAENSGGADGGY